MPDVLVDASALVALLDADAAQHARAVEALKDGAVALLPLEPSKFRRMKALVQQYRELPMDFADAALVRVAERERLTRILTFDKHFAVYRLPRRTRFTVLPSSR